jgi:asparagine synthase (glutamine-hydrolysing)
VLSKEVRFSDLLPFANRDSILPLIEEISRASRKEIGTVEDKGIAVAFSGGIDSSIASQLVAESGSHPVLLALGREGSSDLQTISRLPSKFLKTVEIHVEKITASDIEFAANQISGLVSVTNLAHFEDCVSFWLIAKKAKEISGIDTILSANGPDELFCGYDRFRRIVNTLGPEGAEKEITSALHAAAILGREVRKIVNNFHLDLVEPFLLPEFVKVGLEIPIEYKIVRENDFLRKRIWRLFGRSLGLEDQIVLRPKKAMQYGMGIHAITLHMLKQGTLKLEFPNKRK